MRPAGEVSLAMLQAAHALRRERLVAGRGPTLAEMVARAQVGYRVARTTVANLRRSGRLEIVGTRRVAGRNRPVAEYAPAAPALVTGEPASVVVGGDLSRCMATWNR